MASGEHRCVILRAKYYRDERAEPSVTEHGDCLIALNADLLEDLVGSRGRLDESSKLVGYRVGQGDQVFVGQPEIFSERAVAPQNSEHGAVGAMASKAIQAPGASPASGIDLAHHAAPGERTGLSVDNLADKLMARHAAIGHVPARQFEVGAADAGYPYANNTFTRRRRRVGIIVTQGQFAIEYQRAHRPIETKKPPCALARHVQHDRVGPTALEASVPGIQSDD